MTYRQIPQIIFNKLIDPESLIANNGKTQVSVISQRGSMKECSAILIFEFNNQVAPFATSHLRAFLLDEDGYQDKNPMYTMMVSMEEISWEKDKGKKYQAFFRTCIHETMIRNADHCRVIEVLSQATGQALDLTRRAVREEFWESEMYPERIIRRE